MTPTEQIIRIVHSMEYVERVGGSSLAWKYWRLCLKQGLNNSLEAKWRRRDRRLQKQWNEMDKLVSIAKFKQQLEKL